MGRKEDLEEDPGSWPRCAPGVKWLVVGSDREEGSNVDSGEISGDVHPFCLISSMVSFHCIKLYTLGIHIHHIFQKNLHSPPYSTYIIYICIIIDPGNVHIFTLQRVIRLDRNSVRFVRLPRPTRSVRSLPRLAGSVSRPVDSEHSAIFQCMWGYEARGTKPWMERMEVEVDGK